MHRGVSYILKYFNGYLNEYKNLPKPIYFLFLSRIINTLGAFVGPLMTLLLTDKIGLSTAEAGLYVTISMTMFVPASMIGGYLSDHYNRKNTLCILTIMQSLCYLICGLIEVSMMVPVLLIAASFFSNAAQPASGSITADLTDKDTRQGAFSILYLGTNIGFSIGPLIAGFLYKNYLPFLFIGDAITTIIATIVIYLNIPETKPQYVMEEEVISNDFERAEEGSVFSVLLKRPQILAFAIISMLLTFSYSQVGFSLPLYAKDLFGIEKGAQVFGMLMSTNGIIVVLMTIFIIGKTKKYEPSLNVALSGVFWAVGFGMLYFATSFQMLVISTILWTIGEILNSTNVGVYIANNTPKSHRGRFNSLYGIISGTGQALGPIVIGKYLLNNPLKNVWLIISFTAFLCALIMYVFYMYERYKLSIQNKVR